MTKFLLNWEVDHSKIQVDIKERAARMNMLIKAVQQEIKNGIITDWGAFAGGGKGYCVMEGSATEIYATVQKFVPFAQFEAHPLVSADELDKLIQKLLNA